MKIVPKEQVEEVLSISRGRNSQLRTYLLLLNVGDKLELPMADWKSKKNTPYYIVARVKKSHKRRFEYGKKLDGSGWEFRRLV